MRMIPLLLFALCTGGVWGQERPDRVHDISGVWHSSTGATIRIPVYVYGPQNRFVIVADFQGRPQRYQADWMAGFRQQFRYRTADGDEVVGVVDRDGSNVQLGNGRGWKARWNR